MGVVVVEQAATSHLTTLARVQSDLGVAAGTDDDLLIDMIDRASSAIARETRRVFGVETVTETLDGSGTRLLGLSRAPVVEVTEVTEDGTAIDTADYSIEDAESGALYRADGWGRSGGLRMWGTDAYASGYILPGYRGQRYAVTYRAGWILPPEVNPFMDNAPADPQNLPGAVEQACLETVKAWYLAAKAQATSASAGGVGAVTSAQVGSLRVNFGSSSSSSSSTTTTASGGLPQSALGLLRNYYQGYGR